MRTSRQAQDRASKAAEPLLLLQRGGEARGECRAAASILRTNAYHKALPGVEGPPLTYSEAELETSSPQIIFDNSGHEVQASSAKLPSLSTHNHEDIKKVSPIQCLAGTGCSLNMALLPGLSQPHPEEVVSPLSLTSWLLHPFSRQIACTTQALQRYRHLSLLSGTPAQCSPCAPASPE